MSRRHPERLPLLVVELGTDDQSGIVVEAEHIGCQSGAQTG
jgi:hypothetical protein